MSFNLRCEHLINRPPLIMKPIGKGSKIESTGISHYCNAQRDEFDNPIPINDCPSDCPFFE